jgi:hypothetical protein
MGEVAHDISLLARKLDRNEFIFQLERGQSDFIKDNMAVYFNGENRPLTSNVGSAVKLIELQDPTPVVTDLVNTAWVAYGGCVKGGNASERTLESPGTQNPSGVGTTLTVVEGQVIYIRMKVRKISGTGTTLTLGSVDVNNGEGFLTPVTLPSDGSTIYIGVMVECKHKESITLNVDLARGANTTLTVGISDLTVSNLEIDNLHLQASNGTLKQRINILQDEIENIMNNL